MSTPNEDRTAFPFVCQDVSKFQVCEPGMTLRDYFAATALQALTGTGEGPWFGTNGKPENPWPWYSTEAYRAADAMLTARANRGKEG